MTLLEPQPQDMRPASEAVLKAARGLVEKHFAKCFWFRHPDATIENGNDVYLVIQHLREYGGRAEWREAQELWKSLESCR